MLPILPTVKLINIILFIFIFANHKTDKSILSYLYLPTLKLPKAFYFSFICQKHETDIIILFHLYLPTENW